VQEPAQRWEPYCSLEAQLDGAAVPLLRCFLRAVPELFPPGRSAAKPASDSPLRESCPHRVLEPVRWMQEPLNSQVQGFPF
jgi:hypothetical protein